MGILRRGSKLGWAQYIAAQQLNRCGLPAAMFRIRKDS